MPARLLGEVEAERAKLLGQPRAAPVLGRHHGKRAAGLQGAQGEREGVAALDGAGGRQHHQRARAALGAVLEPGRARNQRRDLGRVRRHGRELPRGQAVDEGRGERGIHRSGIRDDGSGAMAQRP